MPNDQYQVRLQFALTTNMRPLSLQQMKFRPIGHDRYEFQMDVKAMDPVVAIHAARRAAELALAALNIQGKCVKVESGKKG